MLYYIKTYFSPYTCRLLGTVQLLRNTNSEENQVILSEVEQAPPPEKRRGEMYMKLYTKQLAEIYRMGKDILPDPTNSASHLSTS